MPSCVVKWCRSHSDMRKNTDVSFHTFPSNPERCEKWVAAVRLERHESDWMPSKHSIICSIHFRDEDIYTLNNGKQKLLRKSALPICTMVIPFFNATVEPSGCNDLSGSFSYTDDINLQGESSMPLKDHGDEDYFEKNTRKRKLNSLDCSGIAEREIKIERSFNQEFEITIERITEQPGCSYEEDKRCQMMECPSCKYTFYIPTEILESETSLPGSKKLQPQSSAPISVSSSQIESALNTPINIFLKKKLILKTDLAKKRLMKIKTLQQRNKRLEKKVLALKDINKYRYNKAPSGLPEDLVRIFTKKKSKNLLRPSSFKLTPSIKKFALTMNFYSPAAYKYIRSELLTCLPHPSTVCKWYQTIDGKPGFTKEAFRSLKTKYLQPKL